MPNETQAPRRTGAVRQSGAGTADVPSATPRDVSPRKQTVLELLGLPTIPLAAMAAMETRRFGEDSAQVSPYALDVFTLQMHVDGLADAVCDLADSYPVLAAMLDRIGATTPFMAITASVIAIGAQIAENHGKLPETMRGVSPSLVPREDMARVVWEDAQNRVNGRPGPVSDDTEVMA